MENEFDLSNILPKRPIKRKIYIDEDVATYNNNSMEIDQSYPSYSTNPIVIESDQSDNEDDFILNIVPIVKKLKEIKEKVVPRDKKIKTEDGVEQIDLTPEDPTDLEIVNYAQVNCALYPTTQWGEKEYVSVDLDEDSSWYKVSKMPSSTAKSNTEISIGYIIERFTTPLAVLLKESYIKFQFIMPYSRIQFIGNETHPLLILLTGARKDFIKATNCIENLKFEWVSVAPEFNSIVAARSQENNYNKAIQVATSISSSSSSTVSLKQIESEFLKLFSSAMDPDDIRPVKPGWVIKTHLFSYQRMGLSWMIERESGKMGTKKDTPQDIKSEINETSSCLGGILGDDMGLGKTLQIISLIGTNSCSAEDPLRPNKPVKTRGPTLIICPLSVIKTWIDQLDHHLHKQSMTYKVHHGKDKARTALELMSFDIVIATYAAVTNEWKPPKDEEKSEKLENDMEEEEDDAPIASTGASPLFEVEWLRIILDEAHTIRNRKTKNCQAVCSLKAERRWCVTGTFIQNEIDDLYSLLKFLKLKPLEDYEKWKSYIVIPLKNNNDKGMRMLRGVLSSICLRRAKDSVDKTTGKPILRLPPKNICIQRVEFNAEEKQVYQRIEMAGKKTLNNFLKKDQLNKNYSHILEMLLRLRQCCNHLKLLPEKYLKDEVDFDPSDANEIKYVKSLLSEMQEAECQKCENSTLHPFITQCGHYFCSICIEPITTAINPTCYTCNSMISTNSLIDGSKFLKRKTVVNTATKSSSKIEALIVALKNHRMSDNAGKAIVFSQWTGMLDLIEACLNNVGFRNNRIDGSMTRKKREANINDFNSDPSIEVMLISLGAGNLGLNLTVANMVVLIDPWWNPQVEAQAIDRVYRVGQTRPVEVLRFVIVDSAEDRVLELQQKKKELLEQTISGTNTKAMVKELNMSLIYDIFDIKNKPQQPSFGAGSVVYNNAALQFLQTGNIAEMPKIEEIKDDDVFMALVNEIATNADEAAIELIK